MDTEPHLVALLGKAANQETSFFDGLVQHASPIFAAPHRDDAIGERVSQLHCPTGPTTGANSRSTLAPSRSGPRLPITPAPCATTPTSATPIARKGAV